MKKESPESYRRHAALLTHRLSLLAAILIGALSIAAVGAAAHLALDDPATDLSVTKSAADSAEPNTDLTYTIVVSSAGPDTTTATLNDSLPSGTTFVSLTAPGSWSCSTPAVGAGGAVSCTNPSFGVSSGVVFTLVVHVGGEVPSGTFISNTATVSSSGVPDVNEENDSSTASTVIAGDTADLAMSKSASSETSLADRDVTFNLSLTNIGPDTAEGVALNDTLPGDMTFVALTPPAGWSCSTPSVGSGGAITCNKTALTVAEGAQLFTLVGHIPSSAVVDTSYANTATASTTTFDPNSENDTATTTTTVVTCLSNPVVTNTNDSGPGSLRQAVQDACNGDTITFSATLIAGGSATITLTSGEISIGKSVTIKGPTAAGITVSGNNSSRVFSVAPSNTVNLINLTIANGSSDFGGGVYNLGNLTIVNCTLSGNAAAGSSGEGGAIDTEAGTLTIINSTISGNTAENSGGGLLNCGSSTTSLINVTITNNRADFTESSSPVRPNLNITVVGEGGGISQISSNPLTLNNTIVAGNFKGAGTTRSDVHVESGSSINAINSWNNLIGDGTGATGMTNGVNGNQIGSAASPLDPRLGTLADNGGPTDTHLLLPNSTAINAGRNASLPADTLDLDGDTDAGETLPVDQRGLARTVGAAVDIGAVEVNYAVTPTAGTPQSAVITSTFTTALQATVTESGNPQNGISVTFTAPPSGASGTFGASNTAVATTNSGGVATAPAFTANATAGSYNVVASIGPGLPTASFALTNDKASTSTAVSSSLNPSSLGESVTFTATVTSGAGTPTGTVQFKDGSNNLGSPQPLSAGSASLTTSALTVGTHTITAVYSGDANFLTSTGTLSPPQVVNNRPLIKFSAASYSIDEGGRFVTITVNRTGDTAPAVNVDYATPDDSAAMTVLPCSTPNAVGSPRCDFTTALGTLKFAAGQTSRTFVVLISEDSYLEGDEAVTLGLSNLTGGAGFAQPSDATATLTIVDNDFPDTRTPDAQELFVRQHYHDFLNREPDAAGLAFWVDSIHKCEDLTRRPPTQSLNDCIELERINTSAAFFLSIEFQNTGFFVERIHKAAFGDISPPSIPVPVRFIDFLRDTQQVGAGIIVGQPNWETQLANNKAAFTLAFVQRSVFLARYPGPTSATGFVDSLNTNAGNVLSDTERSALIAELSPSAADPALRASVLRKVAENALLKQREFNRAFVLMQYFGYLRRNPDAAPEPGLNFNGYNFWLNKLNSFSGDYIRAEMVKSFLDSTEYNRRFAP